MLANLHLAPPLSYESAIGRRSDYPLLGCSPRLSYERRWIPPLKLKWENTRAPWWQVGHCADNRLWSQRTSVRLCLHGNSRSSVAVGRIVWLSGMGSHPCIQVAACGGVGKSRCRSCLAYIYHEANNSTTGRWRQCRRVSRVVVIDPDTFASCFKRDSEPRLVSKTILIRRVRFSWLCLPLHLATLPMKGPKSA